MTISELRDYLAKYVGEGKGDAVVYSCDSRNNPVDDAVDIVDAMFIEWNDGDCRVVLRTD